MTKDQMEKVIERAVSADEARYYPLYDHASAPVFYTNTYFLRALLRIRPGKDGVPEVVPA